MPIVSYPQELDDQKYDNDPKVRAIKDLYQLLNAVGLDESNIAMRGIGVNQTIGTAYSTTEQLTNEKDTDGHRVYQKVVTGTINVASGAMNIAHGITGLRTLVDYTFIINLGNASVSNSGQLEDYREAGGNWCSPTSFNTTNIVITSSFDWGTSAYRLTLKYTKT